MRASNIPGVVLGGNLSADCWPRKVSAYDHLVAFNRQHRFLHAGDKFGLLCCVWMYHNVDCERVGLHACRFAVHGSMISFPVVPACRVRAGPGKP